jgi:hypothetical protein
METIKTRLFAHEQMIAEDITEISGEFTAFDNIRVLWKAFHIKDNFVPKTVQPFAIAASVYTVGDNGNLSHSGLMAWTYYVDKKSELDTVYGCLMLSVRNETISEIVKAINKQTYLQCTVNGEIVVIKKDA